MDRRVGQHFSERGNRDPPACSIDIDPSQAEWVSNTQLSSGLRVLYGLSDSDESDRWRPR